MGMVVGMDSAFGDMGFECLDQVLTESDKNARKDIKSLAVIQNLYTSDIARCMIWKRVGMWIFFLVHICIIWSRHLYPDIG